jgi:hypothetical protein
MSDPLPHNDMTLDEQHASSCVCVDVNLSEHVSTVKHRILAQKRKLDTQIDLWIAGDEVDGP